MPKRQAVPQAWHDPSGPHGGSGYNPETSASPTLLSPPRRARLGLCRSRCLADHGPYRLDQAGDACAAELPEKWMLHR